MFEDEFEALSQGSKQFWHHFWRRKTGKGINFQGKVMSLVFTKGEVALRHPGTLKYGSQYDKKKKKTDRNIDFAFINNMLWEIALPRITPAL